MKRWIGGVCAAVLCLGCAGGVCALTPPNPQPIKYEITQPSGETFFVYGGESWTPPFDVGTIISATPKENDDIEYILYLNEDGYWYYLEYSEVTYVASNDPDSNVTVRTEEEFWEKIGGSNHYIWDRVEPTIALNTKFMIDPLPNKVLSGHTYLDMRETSQEEKDAMAVAIEAEQERLGKNVTSVISDPGPEMFIYEPVETETAGESITVEAE